MVLLRTQTPRYGRRGIATPGHRPHLSRTASLLDKRNPPSPTYLNSQKVYEIPPCTSESNKHTMQRPRSLSVAKEVSTQFVFRLKAAASTHGLKSLLKQGKFLELPRGVEGGN